MTPIRTTVTLILSTMLLLAGCLTQPSEDDGSGDGDQDPAVDVDATEDPMVPARGNSELFLHAEGDHFWMDTVVGATTGQVTGTLTPSEPVARHTFTLEPVLSRDLILTDQPVKGILKYSQSNTVGIFSDIELTLAVDGAQVASQTIEGMGAGSEGGTVGIQMPISGPISSGSEVSFEVCFCGGDAATITDYSIFVDGESLIDLPIDKPYFVEPGQSPEPSPTGGSGGGATTGEVTTQQRSDGTWEARQTVEHVADAARGSSVSLDTSNGRVTASTTARDDYLLRAELIGRGETEAEARERLEAIDVDFGGSGGVGIDATFTGPNQTAHLTAELPSDAEPSSLMIDSGNGAIEVTGIPTGQLGIDTGNGDIDITGVSAQTLDADTGNGAITAVGLEAADVTVGTGNGQIDLELTPTASGSVSAGTGNSPVRVALAVGADHGYDATATTSNGGATIDLPDTQEVGTQTPNSKRERTTDYDARSIQTVVTATSGNGAVEIVSL